jgi:hypothetical protein
MSAHSGVVKEYFPSMILRSITICLRCQNGGQPTSLQEEGRLTEADLDKAAKYFSYEKMIGHKIPHSSMFWVQCIRVLFKQVQLNEDMNNTCVI